MIPIRILYVLILIFYADAVSEHTFHDPEYKAQRLDRKSSICSMSRLSKMIKLFSTDARDLIKKWQLRDKHTRRGKKDSVYQRAQYYFDHDVLFQRLRKLESQFDDCLNATPQFIISTSLFNSFLDALIVGLQPITKRSLMEIDSYYIKAYKAKIRFDVITFNILLKAVRLTRPQICGGLAAAYLNEMHELDIEPDAFTINELLCMAARNPNDLSYDRVHSNKWVADQNYQYYLRNIMLNQTICYRCPPLFVLNSYLNVYAEDGDFNGMTHALGIASLGGVKKSQINPLETTFQKGLENWQKNQDFLFNNSEYTYLKRLRVTNYLTQISL